MKTITIKQLLVFGLGMVLLAACEKDETKTIMNEGVSGSLSSTATSVALSRETLEAEAISFSHTPTDFGFRAGTVYSLQFALKGTNFATSREVVLAQGAQTQSYSGLQFNNLLLALGLPLDVQSDVEIRLKSTISPSISVYSNVVTINSRPIPLTSWIYVPGGYQGWNPATADSLVSLTGNGIYTGIIAFPPNNGEFKITPAKSWDINYGDAGEGVISATGGNFKAPSAGGAIRLTMNMNTNTWTMEPAAYWSIIGDAIPGSNWGVDTDLKAINDGTDDWIVTVDLTPGQFKFRRNHDWGTNLGGKDGKLTVNGENIPIAAAGNYTIRMNPDALTYELTKN